MSYLCTYHSGKALEQYFAVLGAVLCKHPPTPSKGPLAVVGVGGCSVVLVGSDGGHDATMGVPHRPWSDLAANSRSQSGIYGHIYIYI